MSRLTKIVLTILIIIAIFIGGGYYLLTPTENIAIYNEGKIITTEDVLKGSFINDIKINYNPLSLKGRIAISEKEFKDIIYTTAKKNNIKELENMNISINNNKIKLIYPYNILGFINTQLEVYLNPNINNNNLEITIDNAKLGKLNISDKLVANNIKSFKGNIPFDIKDNVIIVSKDYTYPITIDKVEINNQEILIDLEVYANNLIEFISKYGINTSN